jgi:hypothetical protein
MSMDIEGFGMKPTKSYTGGKVINPLLNGEVRDQDVMEMRPDPFGAEQTYLDEDDFKQARKGSFEMQDDMPEETEGQIDTNKFNEALKKT